MKSIPPTSAILLHEGESPVLTLLTGDQAYVPSPAVRRALRKAERQLLEAPPLDLDAAMREVGEVWDKMTEEQRLRVFPDYQLWQQLAQ